MASSLMRFETWDVVTEIYSFYYQDFTTLLDPNRLYADRHTPKITVEAFTLINCGSTEALKS